MHKTGYLTELKCYTVDNSKLMLVYLPSLGEKIVTSKQVCALWGNA